MATLYVLKYRIKQVELDKSITDGAVHNFGFSDATIVAEFIAEIEEGRKEIVDASDPPFIEGDKQSLTKNEELLINVLPVDYLKTPPNDRPILTIVFQQKLYPSIGQSSTTSSLGAPRSATGNSPNPDASTNNNPSEGPQPGNLYPSLDLLGVQPSAPPIPTTAPPTTNRFTSNPFGRTSSVDLIDLNNTTPPAPPIPTTAPPTTSRFTSNPFGGAPSASIFSASGNPFGLDSEDTSVSTKPSIQNGANKDTFAQFADKEETEEQEEEEEEEEMPPSFDLVKNTKDFKKQVETMLDDNEKALKQALKETFDDSDVNLTCGLPQPNPLPYEKKYTRIPQYFVNVDDSDQCRNFVKELTKIESSVEKKSKESKKKSNNVQQQVPQQKAQQQKQQQVSQQKAQQQKQEEDDDEEEGDGNEVIKGLTRDEEELVNK